MLKTCPSTTSATGEQCYEVVANNDADNFHFFITSINKEAAVKVMKLLDPH